MATQAKAGSFNITTGVADVVVTGVGFTPKAIIFFWTGRTESTDAIGRTNINTGVGAAASPTSRWCIVGFGEDAVNPADTSNGVRDDAVVAEVSGANVFVGIADLKTFDTDGFTLSITDAFVTDLRIGYLALGGSNITNAATGKKATPGVAGNQAFTGVGFQPDFILFAIMNQGTGAPPSSSGSYDFGFGATSGIGIANNALASVGARNAVSPTRVGAYCLSEECVGSTNAEGSAVNERAILNSFDADGFTLNFLDSTATNRRTFFLALKGGNYLVGDLVTKSDTVTDIVETGFGFKPSGILFSSCMRAESSANIAFNTIGTWGIGAADSPTSRVASSLQSVDNIATSECSAAIEHDAVYAAISTGHAIEGLMDLKSIDSDGFTCIMDDADPSEKFVWYVAFGPATSIIPESVTDGIKTGDTQSHQIKPAGGQVVIRF